MSRKHGVGVGVVVFVAFVLLWHFHAGSDTTKAAGSGTPATSTTTTPAANIGVVAKPKIDPRTQPKGSIAGAVKDPKGAPIANATVCLQLYSDELAPDYWTRPLCKHTDAQGAFVYPELFTANYEVTAGAPRFLHAAFHPDGDRHKTQFALHAGEVKTGVLLQLQPGGVEVTGVVNDLTGGPIAHAHVHGTTAMWSGGATSPDVETDDDGTFSLWLEAGTMWITAGADGYANASVTGHAPGKVQLFLTPESTLSGTVVDGKTGAPVEGADVVVQRSEWDGDQGDQNTRSNAKGEFKVAGLPPGRYTAGVSGRKGYGQSNGSALVGLGQSIDGVVVKVFPMAKVVGKVVIAGTKNVCPEAAIEISDEAQGIWLKAKADDDGTVEIDGVRPGTYKPSVECTHYTGHDEYPALVVADKDVTGLTFEVDVAAKIVGHVTNKSGEPIVGATVLARATELKEREKGDWATDITQADGSYELLSAKPLVYKLAVQTDQGVAPDDGFKVTGKRGETVTCDLVLEAGGVVTGTVVDAEGKPVAGVAVRAQPLANRMRYGAPDKIRTDAAGAFTIAGLQAGDYRIWAALGDWEAMRKPGSTDDEQQGEKVSISVGHTVTTRLVVETASGTISGSVVDAKGEPVIDAFLSSVRESDAAGATSSNVDRTRGWGGWASDEQPVITSTDGTFKVTKLAPGTYTLRAYRKGGGEAVAEHVVVGTKTAKLQIKEVGSISGTVTASGEPLSDQLAVSVADVKTGFSRSETFYRAGGVFSMKDLPVGHFKVTASSAGGQGVVEVDLAAGETKTGVQIALQDLITLTGRMTDLQTHQPVAGMRVFASIAAGNSFQFGWTDDEDNVSDASGAFTIKRVPKGKLSIQGMPKDYESSDYMWFRSIRDVTSETSSTVNLGDLAVMKKRLKNGETPGDLGLNFTQVPPETSPDDAKTEVSFIDPKGPAAATAIKVGDVIVTVDGIDVTGGEQLRMWTLVRAPVGTTIELGLARGVAITITLAAPR